MEPETIPKTNSTTGESAGDCDVISSSTSAVEHKDSPNSNTDKQDKDQPKRKRRRRRRGKGPQTAQTEGHPDKSGNCSHGGATENKGAGGAADNAPESSLTDSAEKSTQLDKDTGSTDKKDSSLKDCDSQSDTNCNNSEMDTVTSTSEGLTPSSEVPSPVAENNTVTMDNGDPHGDCGKYNIDNNTLDTGAQVTDNGNDKSLLSMADSNDNIKGLSCPVPTDVDSTQVQDLENMNKGALLIEDIKSQEPPNVPSANIAESPSAESSPTISDTTDSKSNEMQSDINMDVDETTPDVCDVQSTGDKIANQENDDVVDRPEGTTAAEDCDINCNPAVDNDAKVSDLKTDVEGDETAKTETPAEDAAMVSLTEGQQESKDSEGKESCKAVDIERSQDSTQAASDGDTKTSDEWPQTELSGDYDKNSATVNASDATVATTIVKNDSMTEIPDEVTDKDNEAVTTAVEVKDTDNEAVTTADEVKDTDSEAVAAADELMVKDNEALTTDVSTDVAKDNVAASGAISTATDKSGVDVNTDVIEPDSAAVTDDTSTAISEGVSKDIDENSKSANADQTDSSAFDADDTFDSSDDEDGENLTYNDSDVENELQIIMSPKRRTSKAAELTEILQTLEDVSANTKLQAIPQDGSIFQFDDIDSCDEVLDDLKDEEANVPMGEGVKEPIEDPKVSDNVKEDSEAAKQVEVSSNSASATEGDVTSKEVTEDSDAEGAKTAEKMNYDSVHVSKITDSNIGEATAVIDSPTEDRIGTLSPSNASDVDKSVESNEVQRDEAPKDEKVKDSVIDAEKSSKSVTESAETESEQTNSENVELERAVSKDTSRQESESSSSESHETESKELESKMTGANGLHSTEVESIVVDMKKVDCKAEDDKSKQDESKVKEAEPDVTELEKADSKKVTDSKEVEPKVKDSKELQSTETDSKGNKSNKTDSKARDSKVIESSETKDELKPLMDMPPPKTPPTKHRFGSFTGKAAARIERYQSKRTQKASKEPTDSKESKKDSKSGAKVPSGVPEISVSDLDTGVTRMVPRSKDDIDGSLLTGVVMRRKPQQRQEQLERRSDQYLQQKIDHEIRMRDGTAKLLAASKHPQQMLEAAKNLLTSNSRMIAYMSELQRRKTHEVLQRNKAAEGNQTPCHGKVAVSELRIPLMWKDSDHFRNKGDHRRYAVFCLWKIGTEIYDTTILKDVDRSMTDLSFEDIIIFNDIKPDFECRLEVYCHKLCEDLTMASTHRRIKKKFNEISTSVGRSVGKRLSGVKDESDFMSNMLVGPKFEMIANATLKLADITNSTATYDLVTDPTQVSTDGPAAELPLFGHFCCRLAAQPHCMIKETASGFLRVKNGSSWEQRWCQLTEMVMCCYDSPAGPDSKKRPTLKVKIQKNTQVLRGSPGSSMGQDFCFQLSSSSKFSKTQIFAADSEVELEKWWQALQQNLLDLALWQHACDENVELPELPSHRQSSYVSRHSQRGSLYEEIAWKEEVPDSPMSRILARLNVSEEDDDLKASENFDKKTETKVETDV